MIENPKLILLLTSLIGVLAGISILALANPPTDFFYLLPAFALTGLSVADLLYVIVLQETKESNG